MNSTDTPRPETASRPKRELALVSRSTYLKERALQYLFFACAFLAVVTVVLIFAFTMLQAAPVFTDIGLANFFSLDWAPTEGKFGILSLAAGSALVTAGALVLGVPLGVGTAVYLTEIASARVRAIISPAVDLLAGIPSIIYGFFGMVIIRPFVAEISGGLGFGALTAWLVLAIDDRAHHHDAHHRCAALHPHGNPRGGLRHGRDQVAGHLQGRPACRALRHRRRDRARHGPCHRRDHGGAHGRRQRAGHLDSVASPISTLTSQIVLDMSYSSGLHRTALFGMGVVLFIISASLVGIVRMLSKKRKG